MAKQELIPVEQARALLLDTVNTLETEKVPLIEALGRISAKNQTSDIDICIKLQEPDYFTIQDIKEDLEKIFCTKVDIISLGAIMRNFFKKSLEEDAIYI